MDPEAFKFPCDLCGTKVQMGDHRYDGRMLAHYNMLLCNGCYEGNWDGFAPQFEAWFEKHLGSHSIPLPQRNAKGWYPRGS